VVGVEPTRTTSLVRVAAVVVLAVEMRVARIQVGVVAPPGELAAVMVAPVVVNCPARCRTIPTAVEVVHSCRHRRTAE